MQETQDRSLGQKDPLEKGIATHSSILAWRIPGTEEPCRLQSLGSQKVEHDWAPMHCINLPSHQQYMRVGTCGLNDKILVQNPPPLTWESATFGETESSNPLFL